MTRVVRVRRTKERVDSLAILRIGFSLRMWGLDCENFRNENWLYEVGYEAWRIVASGIRLYEGDDRIMRAAGETSASHIREDELYIR